MKIYDFIEIDDNHIPDLFQKGIKDLDIDDMDLAILKAFYALKFENPKTNQISYSDIAEYLASTVPDSDNLLILYFYNEINQRISRLIHLPFIWNLNEEIDAIINNNKDIETIKSLKQYRNNGGSGLLECNFIQAVLQSELNTDGSFRQFLCTHPDDSLDHLFYKSLNIEEIKNG